MAPKPLDAIIKRHIERGGLSESDAANLQVQWERQFKTAEAIVERQASQPTVLLADEVGMGKTYVALAVMAYHIFQTKVNDKKVLLVVPPNNILRSKWEQEIRSFNKNYLLAGDGKRLRPLIVNDYWELIANLHDYQDCGVSRVSEGMLQCFTFAFSRWCESRRQKYKRKAVWSGCGDLDAVSPEYLEFCATYSMKSLFEYLNGKYSNNRFEIDDLIEKLNSGEVCGAELKGYYREFAGQQDSFEPNVFILGMASLRRTKVNADESRLFNTFIAALLLKGCWEEKRNKAMESLSKSKIVISRTEYRRKAGYFDWVKRVGASNLWGMKNIIESILQEKSDGLIREIIAGNDVKGRFKEIQDSAISKKLKESGITLAVVDEVHNWKNEGNGAESFYKQYAPHIPNKLIMSATPFQIHQDELGRVFRYSSGAGFAVPIVDQVLAEDGAAKACINASAEFLKAWKGLGKEDFNQLNEIVKDWKESGVDSLSSPLDASEELSTFLPKANSYRKAIIALSKELSKVVVRHTKSREKRHFHAGQEFKMRGLPDYSATRRTLYKTSGHGDEKSAFLNFIAMRVDQMVRRDMKKGYETNAHILGGITSSNGAFRESNKKILDNLGVSETTAKYLQFFEKVLSKQAHPKVVATATRAFTNYKRGEKTLIYCERLPTLVEIESAILDLIKREKSTASSGIEAKKIREKLLENHEIVEFYWSRSYLSTKGLEISGKIMPLLYGQSDKILNDAIAIATALKISPNQRQSAKILDLCLLREIVFIEKSGGYGFNENAAIISNLISLSDENRIESLRFYLRSKHPVGENIEYISDSDEIEAVANSTNASDLKMILEGPSIWYPPIETSGFHADIWSLLESEIKILTTKEGAPSFSALAAGLLDIPQGFRKALLRLDFIADIGFTADRYEVIIDAIGKAEKFGKDESNAGNILTPWERLHKFLRMILHAEGTINRTINQSSKRQSLWKGVFLREEEIINVLRGSVDQNTRVNLCAAFNSPLLPDILICTAIGSEGIDLHRQCAEVIHHDLAWNPAKMEQKNGRVDRVGSLVESRGDFDHFRLNIGIPFLAHNYEKFQYELVLARAQKFEILLGKPDFPIDVADEDVADEDGNELKTVDPQDDQMDLHADTVNCLPDLLVKYLEMDLSVWKDTNGKLNSRSPV